MSKFSLVDQHPISTVSAVDLNNCDHEPIHRPGTIQPHGMLLGVSASNLTLTAASANTFEHLGRDAHALLNVPLAHILDGPSLRAVVDAAGPNARGPGRLIRLGLDGMTQAPWRTLVHSGPSGILLELKLPRPLPDPADTDLFERFDHSSRRLQGATGVQAICSRLAEEVRQLTGFGRVKIYRFSSDWSGEVIAEDRAGDMPSFLGLHFPASDIPVQARALYALNPERQIPDVSYIAVPIVALDPAPLDLSQAVLRSVSPIHIEYLRNMGVGASMSISILRQGALWGLVACHHPVSHYVAPELRQAGLLLAQLAAWQLAVGEEAEIVRRSVRVKSIETTLLRKAPDVRDHIESLLSNGTEWLDLLQASGFVLSHAGSLATVGKTPPENALHRLLRWLAGRKQSLFETDHLAAHHPEAVDLRGEAAGIVAVSLGGTPANLMVWFRPEVARTVTWSGDPSKPADPSTGGSRLTPRRSFEAWSEEVRGRSRPWERHEITAANGLRDIVVDIILRRSADLEQVNTRLVASNEELEAFAYVASHDLKEPLRQIETFGTMLERIFLDRDARAADAARWFEGIRTSSRRLRALIKDLAEYSRLGREAKPYAPTSLAEIFDNVRADLGRQIEESGAVLRVETALPVVMGDRSQLYQVMLNVISNALKYRHPDRHPVVAVTTRLHAVPGEAPASALPILQIFIADNGIGFEQRHGEQIFEPFQRLHGSDEYEGSGIGLAICRKIMERHRGNISVTSRLGVGSTFIISLPLRPLPPESASP